MMPSDSQVEVSSDILIAACYCIGLHVGVFRGASGHMPLRSQTLVAFSTSRGQTTVLKSLVHAVTATSSLVTSLKGWHSEIITFTSSLHLQSLDTAPGMIQLFHVLIHCAFIRCPSGLFIHSVPVYSAIQQF